MKFSDIDFSAISNMMKNLTPEQMESLNHMADNMMNNMQEAAVPEEEVDFMEGLHLDEDEYEVLPGHVLNALEAAWDMENFYEEEEQADYSASMLFLAKSMLFLMREELYPVYRSVLENEIFQKKAAGMTTLNDYLAVIFNPENQEKLITEGFGDEAFWNTHKSLLMQMVTGLSRAEFDTISEADLQAIKQPLLEEKGLLNIKKVLG